MDHTDYEKVNLGMKGKFPNVWHPHNPCSAVIYWQDVKACPSGMNRSYLQKMKLTYFANEPYILCQRSLYTLPTKLVACKV